ncbi:MAG: hypothetical protein LBQ35_00010 [Spirochaetaceae bacterium]|jgi:hypothetical protein|nr:hypothetical protein [Spirochaetaceae bacterium]
MIDGQFIDTLNIQARDFAFKWKNRIRKAEQLGHFAVLEDGALLEMETPVYPLLSRTLDRGLDRALVGDFFVRRGKEGMAAGFPMSELIYALNLSQQTVIEYIMTDFALDNAMRMYQAMGILNKAAEFFLLGTFYLTKGFLEAIYMNMASSGSVSEEFVKNYFKDDFFFKK